MEWLIAMLLLIGFMCPYYTIAAQRKECLLGKVTNRYKSRIVRSAINLTKYVPYYTFVELPMSLRTPLLVWPCWQEALQARDTTFQKFDKTYRAKDKLQT